eukprot:symbB.v1.2.003621.t1/scaffold203.1/size271217/13
MLDFTLRAKEVQLGRKQLESLTLKGRVAADATVICKVYVSVRSEAWKHHILAWKAKRRNQDLPPCFMGHIRCAGLVERGDDAKLLCVPLPLELQSAGSRPPTESTYDAQSSELLSKLDVQNTHLFSDGNRAWAKCAQEAGIEWSQVKHSVNHRTMTHKGPKPPLQEPPVLGRKTLQHRAAQLASENQLVMVTVPWKAQLAPPEAAGIDFVHPIQIGSHRPHLKQNIARSQRRLLQFARTFAKNGRKVTARTQVIHKMTGATVVETEPVVDGRLRYQLLNGSGPSTGWVTVQAQGKELMRRATDQMPIKERMIRILALAGSLTCKEMIRYQCAPLAAALGKETAEWTFAEGTVQHDWDFSANLRQELWSWYEDIYHCSKERPVTEKQFDKDVVVETVEIEEKVTKLRKRLEEEGPYDIILGFSQGCIMMHYLIGHLRKDCLPIPWKMSLFFEGMHIRDQRYDDLFRQSVSRTFRGQTQESKLGIDCNQQLVLAYWS